MPFGWTNPFRGYLASRKDLRRIARSLERIADHLEGKSPLQPLADHPPERVSGLDVGYTSNQEYGRSFRMEQRLFTLLGRVPTPDEVVVALEEEDAEMDVAKVGDPR